MTHSEQEFLLHNEILKIINRDSVRSYQINIAHKDTHLF